MPVVDEPQLGYEELLEPAMSTVTACGASDNTEIKALLLAASQLFAK